MTDRLERNRPFRSFAVDLALLALSAVVFSFAFPSFISRWGIGPLAFIALVPVPFVLRRNGYGASVLLGMLYGYGTYALFNFWLAKFHPLAHIIVPVIYGAYFLILFPALKAADDLFPRYGHLVQLVVWLAYEYLRTLGFLGYAYGVIGYSQYLFLPVARIAEVTGVWGVSAIVVFPSFFLGRAVVEKTEHPSRSWRTHLGGYLRARKFEWIGYLLVCAVAVTYAAVAPSDFSDSPQWRVALIQQNVDPWRGGTRAYRRSLDIHLRLSVEAEAEDPDIVIWSETAFVPSISWHTRFRTDPERYLLVEELTRFLDGRDIPYVLGNGDGQLADPGRPPVNPDGTLNRVDYNAVLMYRNGVIDDTYRKLRLVPFTESFPFKRQLPLVYQWLKNADTHFWEKGSEYTVFDTGGVKFSTPICYEDTFGYLSREFVRRGAQVIVNITNDSWSASVAAEMQHMAMSVFRAIENRRSMVRSTNGGITCTIEPDGEIAAIVPPFVETALVADVPVYDESTTVYTRFGDWFGRLAVVLAGVLFITGAVLRRRRSTRR